MNCSAICLLTSYISFMKGPDTLSCSYCVDSRSTFPDCYDNVLECAYRDPASLFICLNIYENGRDLITHIGRCVSYGQFYIDDKEIRELGKGGMCKYSNTQHCECNECPTVTTTTLPTTTTPSRTVAPVTIKRKNHHKHHGTHKYDHHHHQDSSLTFHNGSIGTASAYREPQVAASSSFQYILSLMTLYYAYL